MALGLPFTSTIVQRVTPAVTPHVSNLLSGPLEVCLTRLEVHWKVSLLFLQCRRRVRKCHRTLAILSKDNVPLASFIPTLLQYLDTLKCSHPSAQNFLFALYLFISWRGYPDLNQGPLDPFCSLNRKTRINKLW